MKFNNIHEITHVTLAYVCYAFTEPVLKETKLKQYNTLFTCT